MKTNNIHIEGKTLNEIAIENGISLGTVRHRYMAGDRTLERLSRPTENRGGATKTIMCATEQGERLRDEFLKTNLTFEDLRRSTGIKPSTIKGFMYYGTDISSVRLSKLCAKIGTSMDYVMGVGQ